MKMAISSHFSLAIFSALILATNYLASASDPDMMQDFCPAVPDHGYQFGHKKNVSVNGKFCKDPSKVTSEDFKCSGREEVFPGWGFKATTYDIYSCPALNTMGISGALDMYAPRGYIVPHYHLRGSQLTVVKKGYIFMGFMTSTSSGNKFFGNFLGPRHSMVVPRGMLHFSMNIGRGPALTFVAISSQNPGIIAPYNNWPVSSGTHTPIDLDELAKQLSIDKETVHMMKKKLADVGN